MAARVESRRGWLSLLRQYQAALDQWTASPNCSLAGLFSLGAKLPRRKYLELGSIATAILTTTNNPPVPPAPSLPQPGAAGNKFRFEWTQIQSVPSRSTRA